jgi:hypothetical protein
MHAGKLIEKNTCNEGTTLQAGNCGFMSTGSPSEPILTVRKNAKSTTPPNLPKVAGRPLLDQVVEDFIFFII